MSILTLGNSIKQDASTSRRPFFERMRNTHLAKSTISHPQLRDLLICPTRPHHVQTVSEKGVDAHVFGQYTMRLMERPTNFLPNCLVSGCGYVAMGGETADLLIRSADVNSRWESKIYSGNSIVNSVCFYQVSTRSNPQLLVCNNDQTITQYDLSSVSSIQDSASESLSVDPAHHTSSPRHASFVGNRYFGNHHLNSLAIEQPMITHKGSIILQVPVNHCSVSPDLKSMIAVGDSNEVFIYDCQNTCGTNEPLISGWRLRSRPLTLPGVSPSTGSFSTSWSQNGDKFAIASEGEVVVVYDIRNVGKPILVKHTTQKGRAGGARVVKFSPQGPNELLAFTEHQSLVHVLDARTFDPSHEETLNVPTPLPGLNPFPPRLSPGSVVGQAQDEKPGQQTRRSLLNAQLIGSSSRNQRGEEDSHTNGPEEEEEKEEQDGEEGNREGRREDSDGDRLMSDAQPSSSNRGVNNRDSILRSSNSRIFERLWGEISEEDGDRQTLSDALRQSLTRVAASRTRPIRATGESRWTSRTEVGITGEREVEEDFYPEPVAEEDSETSHRSASPSISRHRNDQRIGSSNSASSLRQIHMGGSSIRLLGSDRERRPTSTTHAGNITPTIAGIQSHLIANRLGRRSNARSESWFDISNTNSSNQSYQVFSGSIGTIGVRSGMWDDLIGLSWSPDGDWLVSGTEAGLVEWKVKRSSRTGFGDVRLC
ncbi:WD40-repeat-containing domain protein [Phakopsora pachyrhizi]|nr:WD40-repeat-containing domain protein [Phakopsora pachyrhizi]